MNWHILVSAPYMQPAVERFEDAFAKHNATIIVPPVTERLSESELLDLAGQFDGVIAGDDAFTERVLEACAPRLKVISKWGTGIDSFDLKACERLGIEVRNTPNAFTHPVADSVLGYVLNIARRHSEMVDAMRQGLWEKLPGRALNECTLGIVGVGHIGKAVATRARAFGMRLLGNDITNIEPEFLARTGMQMVDLSTLLEESDFVTVNCDLNPTSRHLIGVSELRQMKRSASLINLARGGIVDETALVRSLMDQEISAAALDVFENEPLPASSALRQMPNVFLAPHNSNSSPTAWEHVHWNTIENLFDVLEAGR